MSNVFVGHGSSGLAWSFDDDMMVLRGIGLHRLLMRPFLLGIAGLVHTSTNYLVERFSEDY